MTEKQWLNARELWPMLAHLYRNAIVSDRKLRLFACACCRRLWPLLEERARRVVVGVEQYADGPLNDLHLAKLWVTVCDILVPAGSEHSAAQAVAQAVRTTALTALPGMTPAQRGVALTAAAAAAVRRGEKKAQRELLRDLFGNPFRPVYVQPAWREWNGGTLVQVARVIYEERRFGDLGVLADALEEAGCGAGELLAHCRSPGPHVLGCWAVDALLQKG